MGIDADQVRRAVAACLQPGRFFAAGRLWLEHVQETIPWEIFQGRLLDSAHTRQTATFEAWNIYLDSHRGSVDSENQANDAPRSPDAEPILSVKFAAETGEVHVVRAILCHVHEGYNAGDNVYLTREVPKWVRERVATLPADDEERLRDEIGQQLFHAVIGTSRLPLTSLEAPLPGFVLGELGYFPSLPGHDVPLKEPRELVELSWPSATSPALETTKRFELIMRSLNEADLPALTEHFLARWPNGPAALLALLQRLFDEVSLSPWTELVPRTLAFLGLVTARGFLSMAQRVDFLGFLLRQLVRHLTAYDLVTFHHQGANYPDALLLDAALHDYVDCLRVAPELFAEAGEKEARRRRRALRQALMLRGFYQGHPVPDAPTSPGENARVLPPPHVRVPEEQILYPHRRTKALYEAAPFDGLLDRIPPEILERALADLQDAGELRELGTALFLDRPLDGEGSPLFSYEAYSPSIALRRLRVLHDRLELIDAAMKAKLHAAIDTLPEVGVALPYLQPATRPGTVALGDTLRVADDFRILRTTRRSVRAFVEQFKLEAALERFGLDSGGLLIVRGPAPGTLVVYAAAWQPCCELRLQPSGTIETRHCVDGESGSR